jgi:phage terminase large subunit-like protein
MPRKKQTNSSARKVGRASVTDKWAPFVYALPGYDPCDIENIDEYRFDAKDARIYCDFFEECLTHVKGEKARQPFMLEDWQRGFIANLYGWKNAATGLRRYRKFFLFIPRKNGKTPLAAGLILASLYLDGEQGAEVYGAAAEYKQASLVFEHAMGMVAQDEMLRNRFKVYAGQQKAIEDRSTFSSYKVLSAEAYSKHGYNTHLCVIDELHAHPDGDLCDVMETSIGARREPIIGYLTTSDYDRENSICNETYDYACAVRDGDVQDASFLPVIYECPRDQQENWTDPDVWAIANPNLGVSISREYLESACKEAQRIPRKQNEFKRLHLNIRTTQKTLWIDGADWDACEREIDWSELRGLPCWAGLDLAKTTDICALCLVYKRQTEDERDEYILRPYFWAPADRAAERERVDRVPYRQWERQGLITLTPGIETDYRFIRQQIIELAESENIREMAFDPWNATAFIQTIEDHVSCPCIEFRQTIGNFAAPTKEVEGLVNQRLLVHDGHRVLREHARNCEVKTDPSGNIRPVKPDNKSAKKIDGIVSAIMGLSRAMLDSGPVEYACQRRGFVVV